MPDEVLILGATGRTGRGIAQRLDRAGVPLGLYGRDGRRLAEAVAQLTQDPRLVTGSLDDLRDLLRKDRPAVVVSTVGPFASTASSVIDSLPAGTHYLDLSNEYASFEAVFARNEQAVSRGGQILIPGAGFGVVATESVLVAMCDRPTPTHVRVDALPSLAAEEGVIGDALAGSIVDSLPSGRLQVRDGRLSSAAFDDTPAQLLTPDGEHLHSANFPSGDLLTAWRISQAPNVVAGSTEVPSGPVIRYALPIFSLLARSARLRRLATTRLAKTTVKERPKPRPNSWGHAAVKWADGTEREGWLRVEDPMNFTCAVAAEVAQRLLRREGRPGAHTPCALFGAGLAVTVGGEFVWTG